MERKILTAFILSTIFVSSFVSAAKLSLEPSNGSYSPGCMLGIDIVMDPDGAQISATDIITESSMQFVKFEPTKLFPYFFPPKITGNVVHIIGFTALGQSQWISQKGVIGKIYFKPSNKSDRDGSIKFYIKKQGDTTDTSLNIGGGIDVLKDVSNGFYTFNGTKCDYQEENINNEITLEDTIKRIEKDHKAALLQKSREDNKSYIISLFIIVVILVAYFKLSKGKSKKK